MNNTALLFIVISLATLVIIGLITELPVRRFKGPFITRSYLDRTGKDWTVLVREKGEAESKQSNWLEEVKREEKKARLEKQRLRQEWEYNRKLEDHQRRFKCCVASCTIVSTGPGRRYRHVSNGRPNPIGWELGSPDYGVTDWNIPTGLQQCNFCGGYACPIHIMEVSNRQFMCKNCGVRYINS